ncbi:MAG: antibiotic biosynthesis monooxygenase [Alphaproteobacteria bacterium]|nr:antibiotic biosynthesis monooxygenase [Alphaproteobacteria bacterium]
MIIVLGSVLARPETFDELRTLGLQHVHRSRGEPGCISHDVHVHSENPLNLVFVEKWHDAQALAAHFRVRDSIDFVVKARELSAAPPAIEMFEATVARVG